MFKKIKRFFFKKKETKKDVVSAITLYTDESGEVFVDLKIKDTSDQSVDHLSSILTMFNSTAFVQVNDIIKEQCKINQETGLHLRLMESFINKVGVSFFIDDSEYKSDSPCIKPDEMI